MHNAPVIHHITSLDVVGPVCDNISPLQQISDVGYVQARDVRKYLDGRHDTVELTSRGLRLRNRPLCVLPRVERLTVQVGELDRIAVDKRQPPDPCPAEKLGDATSDRPDSDKRDMRP